MRQDVLRVGNGAGFWGDNLDAPYLLARDGCLDVLTLEYLAELTLAILAHLRVRDPSAGYVNDFPELLPRLAPLLKEQPRLKIVTNAGGLNPHSCASRCGEILDAAGLGETCIAVVSGDDVLSQLPSWIDEGIDLAHMETGRPISDVLDRLVSANAYLGAEPIARALTRRRADRRDRTRGRCIFDARPGGCGIRVDVGRLAEARKRVGRRTRDRMRRTGDGRALA